MEDQPKDANDSDKKQQIDKIKGILFKNMTQQNKPEKKVKPDQINENIYLGCYASSCNKEFLKEKGITRILMCLGHIDPPFPGEFNYKKIPIQDWEGQDLFHYFEDAYQFIQDGIFNNQKILIHCYAGVSRSVAILTAYFIKRDKKHPHEIIDFIREKREGVCPNSGFMMQLVMYYSYIESTLPKPRQDIPSEIKPQKINQSKSDDPLNESKEETQEKKDQ